MKHFLSIFMNHYDNLYKKHFEKVPDFLFDQKVVSVFENMIERSVPGYRNLLENIVLLVKLFFQDGTRIYDMGCSTGIFLESLIPVLKKKKIFIEAVDSSEEMIQKANSTLKKYISENVRINFLCDDMCSIGIKNASVVILNFSLQFIPLSKRDFFLKRIYNNLREGGILILSEKVSFSNALLQKEMTRYHHFFKKQQGYSDLEITQKRKSLENILKTDSLQMIEKRLALSGFHKFFQYFQSFNFISFLAIK